MKLIWPRSRLHYAWLILASIMVINTVSAGVRLSFGVLIDPLVEQYGWSRSAISFAYTLTFLVAIPVYLVIGRIGERINSRRLVIAGSLVFMTGVLLTATVTQIWQFLLYFGVINGVGTALFMLLLPVLLTRWFYRRLGLALGLMWTSLSLGPAIFSPLLRWAIDAASWRETFIVVGIVGGGLMLVSSLFIRDDPKEKRLTTYGGLPPELQLNHSGVSSATLGLSQVRLMTSFWTLTVVHALGCVSHSVLLAHVVSIATFNGIPSVAAAGVLSIILATSLISRFGTSLLAEAKGARFTLTLIMLFQTLPILLLLIIREVEWFYAFAFLFGLGYGGEMVGFPIFNRQYYGLGAPLKSIYAYQMVGASLGMAIGGWLGGTLFDGTGAYTWSILAAVISGSMGVFVAIVLPAQRRQQ